MSPVATVLSSFFCADFVAAYVRFVLDFCFDPGLMDVSWLKRFDAYGVAHLQFW